MRILFLFCDMLRANLLKTFNQNIKQNGPMDHLFNKIGGTAFINCYTPAPDTPRSLACLYTGLYPKNNGCNTRIKWPKYYQNIKSETIFDIFEKTKIKSAIFVDKHRINTGFLPLRLPDEIGIYNSAYPIRERVNSVLLGKRDIFSFIVLNDYHHCIEDYGGNSLGDYWGQKHLCNYLDVFFNDCDIDSFDYIFLLSDHGCLLSDETKENKLFLTNDKRTKTVMFVRKKGDSGIVVNDKLSTIMDVLPTIKDILGVKNKLACDGISLFDQKAHDSVVIEDHKTFGVTIDQVLENWAIRTNDFFYFTNLSENALFRVNSAHEYEEILNLDVDIVNNLEKEIEIKSSSYEQNKKQYNILKYYSAMSAHNDAYSDGVHRTKYSSNLIFRLIRKIIKNRYRRW